jgi:hypothetical protein
MGIVDYAVVKAGTKLRQAVDFIVQRDDPVAKLRAEKTMIEWTAAEMRSQDAYSTSCRLQELVANNNRWLKSLEEMQRLQIRKQECSKDLEEVLKASEENLKDPRNALETSNEEFSNVEVSFMENEEVLA